MNTRTTLLQPPHLFEGEAPNGDVRGGAELVRNETNLSEFETPKFKIEIIFFFLSFCTLDNKFAGHVTKEQLEKYQN